MQNPDTKKNILFISYDGMTDPLGESQVIPYMQGLTSAGYHITILSCEKPAIYQQSKSAISKLISESGMEWVPIPYTKKPPVLSTLYDTWRLKKEAAKIHKKTPIHMVHTRSGTPALVGRWLKKKFGIKFLHDIRDFYADSRVDSGSWDQNSFLYRKVYQYLKKAEADQLQNCDGAVCLTYAAEKILRQSPDFDSAKPLMVIPCSVDLALFDQASIDQQQKTAVAQQLNIREDDIIISYLGSIGGWYMVKEMMQFFTVLLQKIPKAKFLFISPNSHDFILENARQYNIPEEKIISVKAVRKEIPTLLSLSQYAVFFIKPCFSKQASSPTKHGELMAMGIPVITNTGVGDLATIVEKYNSGILLHEFTDQAFDDAVKKLSATSFNPSEIRKGALEFYSLSQAVAKYTEIYSRILGGH
jgi:glycosyltransferase involved in cell wall biosynthesis